MTDHPMLRHTGGFVVMPNEAVNDSRLSFRARGILAYLLGRPPGWRFSAERICKEGKEGRDAVAAAMRELTEAGYYRWTRTRTGDGRIVVITEVAATPSMMPTTLPVDTDNGFPGAGAPGSGEPPPGEPGPMSGQRITQVSQDPPQPSAAPPRPRKAAGSSDRGTRLPEDWKPTEALLAYTVEQGMHPDDVARWNLSFVDYWLAIPGARGRKTNWDRTWQRWMRESVTREAGRVVGNRHTDPEGPEHDAIRKAFGE